MANSNDWSAVMPSSPKPSNPLHERLAGGDTDANVQLPRFVGIVQLRYRVANGRGIDDSNVAEMMGE